MSEKSFKEWSSMSDDGLLKSIGGFVQHHRLNQNKSQTEVARAAGISRSTLSLLERGEKTSLISFLQVLRALDLLHVMENFQVSDEISPMEYAKLQKQKRQRASVKPKPSKEETEW